VLWIFRAGFSLLIVTVVCVAVATVPIGRKTLVEHTLAIFSTRPARQLGRDLAATGEHLGAEVRGALRHVADLSRSGGDGEEDEPRAFGNPP
jgi:hypothetical protein